MSHSVTRENDAQLGGNPVVPRISTDKRASYQCSWSKFRINRGQEFVVGGFFPGPHGIDTIVIGYYRGKDLIYAARTRNGFVPATRRAVCEKLKPLITDKCPFVNLPETGRARWGEILDAVKMKKCVWVRPKLVAVIEFLEWTRR